MMEKNNLLAGRRALVTGGGSGIGKSIVKALAAAGAWVAVTDKNGDAAAAVAKEVGKDAISMPLDVTDAAATAQVFDKVIEEFGGLDIVCANAGVSTMNKTIDLTEAEWDFNMNINAKGVFLTNQAAVRRWLASNSQGVIVNTASLAGKIGAPLLAHYSASKFAVVGFTQALAREVGKNGIRVNCVCPGFVRTGMQEREIEWEGKLRGMTPAAVREEYISLTPLGRIQEAEDVADIVVFLASDLARFLTGEAINASGGVLMD
ncbi:SDR family NAD(P)-dependent oxidoreductase [Dongia soli]|uniref:SDR family NAD(P)-dependent oxidoreductase n=1 Tax=Dongia soli TaxID=600628 RepID=A0ABU5EDM1_9PROT|nr:SDR family NAD(P)-dependent oxidoreductase [Dongia soli]MDY0884455.1 SDR family NAD(P)-dependent oxidoreductase [Dongia soli]